MDVIEFYSWRSAHLSKNCGEFLTGRRQEPGGFLVCSWNYHRRMLHMYAHMYVYMYVHSKILEYCNCRLFGRIGKTNKQIQIHLSHTHSIYSACQDTGGAN